MRVAMVGTGYVGLVTAACLASRGHDVTCVDVDPARVAAIEGARAPFFEVGLRELLAATVPRTLRATTDLEAAVVDAKVTIIAVGTPFNGGGIDLGQIETAARAVGRALACGSSYQLVVVKSTVLPGTTDRRIVPLLETASGRRAGPDFGVAMNPEFLREGQAVEDFLTPDRIVMGGIDERSWQLQEELYAPFDCPDLLRTGNTTAEMIKYTSNSLLATMISFTNEIGNLCRSIPGVDVTEVMRAVHLDKRLSPIESGASSEGRRRVTPEFTSYLMAGCGFGGSCLPKDVRSLVAYGEEQGRPMALLRSALTVNAAQSERVLEIVDQHFPSLVDVPVAVLGLAFKPGTSDVRETPALPVIEALRARGAAVRAYDPAATDAARCLLGDDGIDYAANLDEALAGVAAVVVLTSWPEFGDLPDRLAGAAEPPVVIDGRRMFDPATIERYDGIGRGPEPRRDRDPR